MMVKVAKLFTGVLRIRCYDNFIEKHLCRSLFRAYRPRSFTPTGLRKTPAQVFSCEFYQIFQNVFFFFFFFFIAKHLCVTFSAEYPFFRYADLSQQKRFLQPWLL